MTQLPTIESDRLLAQGELLARLLSHPSWGTFVELLKDMRTDSMETLALSADPGDIRFWQGAVAMLKEIIERPKLIVEAAAETQEAEEQERRQVIRPELRSLVGMGVDPDGAL